MNELPCYGTSSIIFPNGPIIKESQISLHFIETHCRFLVPIRIVSSYTVAYKLNAIGVDITDHWIPREIEDSQLRNALQHTNHAQTIVKFVMRERQSI